MIHFHTAKQGEWGCSGDGMWALSKDSYPDDESGVWIGQVMPEGPWAIMDFADSPGNDANTMVGEIICGPFDTLDAAKAAYLILFGRT